MNQRVEPIRRHLSMVIGSSRPSMLENKRLRPNLAGHWMGKPMHSVRLATILANSKQGRS